MSIREQYENDPKDIQQRADNLKMEYAGRFASMAQLQRPDMVPEAMGNLFEAILELIQEARKTSYETGLMVGQNIDKYSKNLEGMSFETAYEYLQKELQGGDKQ